MYKIKLLIKNILLAVNLVNPRIVVAKTSLFFRIGIKKNNPEMEVIA
jgi:hypothetical protein